jgi:5-methylcytosine-specific restriction protein A
MATLTRQDFEKELKRQLAVAQAQGKTHVDINSGELHRDVGGYPSQDYRMPICCDVMTG